MAFLVHIYGDMLLLSHGVVPRSAWGKYIMPSKALRFCSHPGCGELVSTTYCTTHQPVYDTQRKERQAEFERTRLSAAERGYDSRWQKARLGYLKHHPLCAECEREGKTVPATVVDHIVPHKGNKQLFWDKKNWQPLCKPCHDRKTAKEDGRWG